MNSWIPLWTSTVDSTLWEEPLHVRVMFLTLLLMRDPDQVVRQPFRRVCKKANLSEEPEQALKLAQEALKILSEPDTLSVDDQEFGGRRIRQLPDGWLILNGKKYDEEMKYLTARLRKSQKQRERRDAQRAQPSGIPDPTRAEERAELAKNFRASRQAGNGGKAPGAAAPTPAPSPSAEFRRAEVTAGDGPEDEPPTEPYVP